jgi:hypothetical protein
MYDKSLYCMDSHQSMDLKQTWQGCRLWQHNDCAKFGLHLIGGFGIGGSKIDVSDGKRVRPIQTWHDTSVHTYDASRV